MRLSLTNLSPRSLFTPPFILSFLFVYTPHLCLFPPCPDADGPCCVISGRCVISWLFPLPTVYLLFVSFLDLMRSLSHGKLFDFQVELSMCLMISLKYSIPTFILDILPLVTLLRYCWILMCTWYRNTAPKDWISVMERSSTELFLLFKPLWSSERLLWINPFFPKQYKQMKETVLMVYTIF